MKEYKNYSKLELLKEKEQLEEEYNYFKNKRLSLNMARGKPCKEQLNLSMGMMDVLNSNVDLNCEDGTDCRNYGVLGGIDECKRLLGDIIEVPAENIIIYGNSSLNVMYDCISRSMTHGVMGSTPWAKLDKVKWLCPVPGYDRHFAITEWFGIEMINIPMNNDGPDMDMIEKLVSQDDSIKGIWCVPKYSNPDGTTYSEKVVKRFAALKPKAKDFRIYWDNAYSVHHLYSDNQDFLLEILDECKKAGNPDIVYKFTSTSKISFPGSGIAALAASSANIASIKKQLSMQTIGFDKVNQLRHVKFFKNLQGIKDQMTKHAEILRPKFELVENILEQELGGLGIATWTKPHGGYFISLNTMKGIASDVVEMCKNAGVILTPAGSTYPYHKDPNNSNIRIAPSYPVMSELETASKILSVCVKICAINKYLNV
ncbi:MAG: aminotransferase class I/II-fold pyridoxal phosphate-dependent enzyme [Bacilli bacterium]|nr:aminotransferase class I/II-fold pyridoxal phosphate-dependent enzyme [Bacilli bacterium]